MQEQWAKISENLKKMLDSGVFKVWIAPLHATVGGDSLQLTAPSAFVAHWLEHKMLPALQQAAAPVLVLDPAAIAVKVGVATDRRAREADPAPSRPAIVIDAGAAPRLKESAAPTARVSRRAEQAPLPLPLPAYRPAPALWRYSFADLVVARPTTRWPWPPLRT